MSKPKQKPQELLRAFMAKHNLTRLQVAKLAMRSKSTIDAWLAPEGASWRRKMGGRDYHLIVANFNSAK